MLDGVLAHCNLLTRWRFEWNFIYVICKRILVIDGWGISFEIAIIWMSLDFTNDQSTLVQVMPWCCQATSHYLSQCWYRSRLHMVSLGPWEIWMKIRYRKISNIRRTLVSNKIVDHSDVVGATTSSFSTQHLASRDSAKTAAREYENLLSVGIWCALY